MNAAAAMPEVDTPDARGARADPRVAAVLYRTALAGDRRAVLVTVLGSFFVALLVERRTLSHVAWVWCAACVALAGTRLLFNRPRPLSEASATSPVHRRTWLLLLLAASAVWG